MASLRVAVDVGGTFTDIFVFDQSTASARVAKVPSTPSDPMEGVMAGIEAAGVDLRDVALFSHGTTVATNALITRRFPRVAMVTTRGFRDVIEIRRGTKDDLWDAYKDVAPPYVSRRDRLEVARAHRLRRRACVEGLDEDEARAGGRGAAAPRRRGRRGLLRERVRQPGERAADAGDPRGGAARRRRHDVQRRAARDLRARALLDHRRQRRAVAARRRLRAPARRAAGAERLRRRPAAAALRRRRHDPADGRAVRRAAGRLRHRRRRHRVAPRRAAVRLRELDRPRHGRHVDGHLAGLRRRVARHEGVVRRVRLPDLLPVDRGADDRRGRRLAGLDRLGRLAAQRPAVRGRRSRPRLLRPRRHAAHQHRRQRRAGPARHDARRRHAARPGRRRARDPRGRRRAARPRRWSRRRAPCCRSPTPTWPTPCG